MRRFYEEPVLEINKFYFEEILSGMLNTSDPEGDIDEDGGDVDTDIWD